MSHHRPSGGATNIAIVTSQWAQSVSLPVGLHRVASVCFCVIYIVECVYILVIVTRLSLLFHLLLNNYCDVMDNMVHDAVSRNCLEKHDSWTDWVSSAPPPRRYSPREGTAKLVRVVSSIEKRLYRPANIYLILMNCLSVFHACYFVSVANMII